MTSVKPFTVILAEEINLLRADPPAYASKLEAFKTKFIDDKILLKDNGVKIRTKKGKREVERAISILTETSPLHALTPCAELEQSALDHATDQEKSGIIGTKGNDGSLPSERIRRHGNWIWKMGENVKYGSETAEEVVVGWVIDDADPKSGHRSNILNQDFYFVGSAIAIHPVTGTVCVCDFAHKFA